MPNYVIIAPADSNLTDERIASKFERSMAIRPDCAWAVSTPISTCADVRKELVGADPPDGPQRLCVIVKANEYNGYATRELWEKLEVWGRD